jgi:hypothetical protein
VLFSARTKDANLCLQEQGEARIKSGKQMGEILTSLGFTDRTLKDNGTVLIVSRETREQAHVLQRLHCIHHRGPGNCLFPMRPEGP